MPISSTQRKVGPTPGNGTSRDFPFTFKVFDPSQVEVIRTSPNGGDVALAQPTDYVVTLNSDQNAQPGGNVRLSQALAADLFLTILSAVPIVQLSNWQSQGGFNPDDLDDDLDRQTAVSQQIAERLGRTLVVPATASDEPIQMSKPKSGMLLGWSDDGTRVVNIDPKAVAGFGAFASSECDIFTGDGIETVFNLSVDGGSLPNLRIAIAGVAQTPGVDFVWNGGTEIEFAEAPGDGLAIVVQYFAVMASSAELNAAVEIAEEAAGNVVNLLPKAQYPTIKEMLAAAGDGVTNVGPTLARTDVDFITLPPGNFRVTTNCTITRPLYAAPGSYVTVDPSATVTFAGKGLLTSDCRRQVFYGTGAVLGLPNVDLTWFVGDKMYFFANNEMVSQGDISASMTGANADADLQRAFNAVRACGSIDLQEGVLTKGPLLISSPVQVSVRGRKQSSIFIWNSAVTNGFSIPYERSSMGGFTIRRANLDLPSASGSALVASGGSHFYDFNLNGCYVGVNSDNQSGPLIENFNIFNARSVGIALTDTNDPIVQNGFIVTDDEYTLFSGAAGGWNPQPGNTLTGATSGCQMRVKRIGSTFLIASRFYGNANKPQIGETFNCSSGGSAVLATYTMNHDLGGLRIVQNDQVGPLTEAVMLNHLDIIGGRYNITIDGAAATFRNGPSYNRASTIWLDSALDDALLMSNTDGWTFEGLCIQSRFDGLAMANVRNIRFIGGDIRHCASAGVVAGAACNSVDFIGMTIADNRYGIAGNAGAHVYIANDAATRITFVGGAISRSGAGGITTDYGISLTGSGGQLYLWGVRFGPTADLRLGAISGLSSLTRYTVDACSGMVLKNRGAFQIATGQSASADIFHGLTVPVTFNDIRLTCSDPGGLGKAYAAATPSADITPTTFKTRLYDIDAALVNAARTVTITWEIDLSYKV